MKSKIYIFTFFLAMAGCLLPYLAFSQVLAAGSTHSLSLCYNHTLKAWGHNQQGALGDGSTGVNSNTPVSVLTLSQIVYVEAGPGNSLALKSDSTVWGFGSNSSQVVGDGTNINRFSPVQVHGPNDVGFLTGIKAISVGLGYGHCLALKNDGTVWAWGMNAQGALGDSTKIAKSTPVQVRDSADAGYLTYIRAITAGGDFSMALHNDSTVWTWGINNHGQLGDSSTKHKWVPKLIGLTRVVKMGAGTSHAMAIRYDGSLWAWGYNAYGQLGIGTTANSSAPQHVSGISDVVAVDGGQHHTMALKSDGTVWTWGYNAKGQLGDSTNIDRSTPMQVPGLTNVIAISAGGAHSMVLKADGTIWAWGDNSTGQLGDGTTITRWSPVQVSGTCQMVIGVNVDKTPDQFNITAYPNPFSSEVTLKSDELFKDATLIMYNSVGEAVQQLTNISGHTVTVQRNNLPAGLYFIHVIQDNKVFTTDKLVIGDN